MKPCWAKRWLNQNKSYRCSRINVNGMLWGQRDIIKACQSLESCSGRQNLTKVKWICIAKYIWQLKKHWSLKLWCWFENPHFFITISYSRFRICWGFDMNPFLVVIGWSCWLTKYWTIGRLTAVKIQMCNWMHLFYCFIGSKKPLLLWLLSPPPPSCYRHKHSFARARAILADGQLPRTWICALSNCLYL